MALFCNHFLLLSFYFAVSMCFDYLVLQVNVGAVVELDDFVRVRPASSLHKFQGQLVAQSFTFAQNVNLQKRRRRRRNQEKPCQ